MKRILLLENVMMPNCPGFKKGQEVKVNDELGELLVKRGHAKSIKEENRRLESKELKERQKKEKKEKKSKK